MQRDASHRALERKNVHVVIRLGPLSRPFRDTRYYAAGVSPDISSRMQFAGQMQLVKRRGEASQPGLVGNIREAVKRLNSRRLLATKGSNESLTTVSKRLIRLLH